jgi:hypothetical protein
MEAPALGPDAKEELKFKDEFLGSQAVTLNFQLVLDFPC